MPTTPRSLLTRARRALGHWALGPDIGHRHMGNGGLLLVPDGVRLGVVRLGVLAASVPVVRGPAKVLDRLCWKDGRLDARHLTIAEVEECSVTWPDGVGCPLSTYLVST